MTARRLFLLLLLGVVLLVASTRLFHHSSPELPVPHGSPAAADPAVLAAGADDGWWQAVSTRIRSDEYHACVGKAGLQAPNRAQNLRTHFRKDAIEVVPREEPAEGDAWRLLWSTTRWGREDQWTTVEPTAVRSEGARVIYPRQDLDEWYENKPEGLEQGFTVHGRPEGKGWLCLTGRLEGGLHAQPGEDGAVDFVDDAGARVLNYGQLKAWDADGRVLPSRLRVDGEELAILVDDADAEYPLTIDPLLTTPSWTAESNQASASFGISVATAGDVNGDGFSDVIVGSYAYDNGETDEGRAFVYHGSAAGLSLTAAWTAESNQPTAYFGWSVASAGDVNGDGYSDVLVGAFRYDNGQVDEGRAFVYHGSAVGLSPTAAWTAESQQPSAFFGSSVAAAGDVNGDGFSDVIVGAWSFDNGQADEGRAFVYYGAGGGLDPAPAWTAESNQALANFGILVRTAGDVNADGFADVIIGAWLYDNGQADEGRAFVYHGSAAGLGASPSWTAEGDQATSGFGRAAGTAGDVNGDGYADVVVGAYTYDNGQSNEGRVFVYHGSSAGLLPEAAWIRESDQSEALFGNSVATAGDVNGDGYADIIIGASRYDNGQADEGRAVVYEGSAGGVSAAPSWTAECNQALALFGGSVGTAGDVNGDGLSEVIVGADGYDNGQADEGRTFLYNGLAVGLATSPGWTTGNSQATAYFGTSVGTAGDVNGDGYSDVIVGAYSFDNGEVNEGRAYVYHGSAAGLSSVPAWTAESNQAGGLFGVSVATAGDVNGDGYSDVIVGAYEYDGDLTDEGRAYVYHGSFFGLDPSPAWYSEGNEVNARYGVSVGTAGDVNGDGYSEVIVGTYYINFAGGRATVYHGSASGLGAIPGWTATCDQGNALFGQSVGTAGDVNRDGFADVIVGATGYSNGQASEGRAFVYHGSASGIGLSPAWTGESNIVGGYLGETVGTAGDVNGDGFSDVIVGSEFYSNGENEEGRVWAFYGSPTGLGSSAAWTVEGNESSLYLGFPVGTAGDVNGDGYSDVILGATSPTVRGRLYHGSATGLALTPAWTATLDHYGGQRGATAGAGDVNGDGFSDVIIGADQGTPAMPGGEAFLYYGNSGDGLELIPQQYRADATAPIDAYGLSDSDIRFRLNAVGRTPAGRSRVRFQWEVKPFGTPFDGVASTNGIITDTGTPGIYGLTGSAARMSQLVGNLNAGSLYHWRVRILGDSPDFPHSRWLTAAFNSPTEADVRIAPTQSAVEDANPAPRVDRFLLQAATPNPFSNATRLAYTLRERGVVRLAVYDVAGREVTMLADQVQTAGDYTRTWDGRDASGQKLSTGVYFVRLQFGAEVEARKVVIAR